MSDTEVRLRAALEELAGDGSGPTVGVAELIARRAKRRIRRAVAVAGAVAFVAATVVSVAALQPKGQSPTARPTLSLSPETRLALTIARSAARGAHVTQAAYIVATPKAVESVLHPGEDNLQRLIPAGHQMLVIKMAGTFTADRMPYRPSGNTNAPPPRFTSLTVFCDALTGEAVSGQLAGGPTPDVITDLSRFGEPVALSGL